MRQGILQRLGRKRLTFLVLSLVLFAYLALVREDTTRADLAIGGSMVLALWALAALRAFMPAGQMQQPDRRGTTDAR